MNDLAERALANSSAAIQMAQGLHDAHEAISLELQELTYQAIACGEHATTDALLAVLHQHNQRLAKVHQDYVCG